MDTRLLKDSIDSHERIGDLNICRGDKKFFIFCEDFIQKNIPWAIHYDLNTPQGVDFTTFTYGESILDSFRIKTLSSEVNIRILLSTEDDPQIVEKNSKHIVWDNKYRTKPVSAKPYKHLETLAIMPGGNLNNLINWPFIDKWTLIDEKPLAIKLHPVSREDFVNRLLERFGPYQIIREDTQLTEVAAEFDTWMITTASESAVWGQVLGKNLEDITMPDKRHTTSFVDIATALKKSDKNKKDRLTSILFSEFSGYVFPFQSDVEQRLMNYFEKSLEVRSQFDPILKSRFTYSP